MESEMKSQNELIEKLRNDLEEAKLNTVRQSSPKRSLKQEKWKFVSEFLLKTGSKSRNERLQNSNTPKTLVELLRYDQSPKTLLYVKHVIRKSELTSEADGSKTSSKFFL
eukprot:TRINITY_DN6111_c0_g1_i1.p1 TRINITY_DN6111_c0_g1~~TRINITY_DN6111_c0_g1_i1.p1  ORF type:complete len:110 (+),score=28.89 TRINITY_DN6111_c0_g1_i1:425-754(+)